MRSSLAPWALLLVLPLWLGCSESKEVVLESKTNPPLLVELSSNLLRIPAGIALGVEATPEEGGDKMDSDTRVELTSTNTTIVGVDRTLEKWVFVVYGVAPGAALIRAKIDSETVQQIQVQVDSQ